jgi:hypothetical protein
VERKDARGRQPIDQSPSVDLAINDGYPWLEIECSRCKTARDVDMAALTHPPTIFIRDLASSFGAANVLSRSRPAVTLFQLAQRPPCAICT